MQEHPRLVIPETTYFCLLSDSVFVLMCSLYTVFIDLICSLHRNAFELPL